MPGRVDSPFAGGQRVRLIITFHSRGDARKMASQFLSLEDAAKKLGVTTDRLVELRSQGKIRGFRDGSSWKFPEGDLDRLADDLASESGAYDPYRLAMDEESQRDAGSSGISDVNLVPGDSNGSDVKVVSAAKEEFDSDFILEGGKSALVELDSAHLQLAPDDPVISHDSEVLDLSIEPNAGSTGPITDAELKEVRQANEAKAAAPKSESGLKFDVDEDDSGEDLIGGSPSGDMLDSDIDLGLESPTPKKGASNLELMDELDLGSGAGLGSDVDVLSEFDLLSAEAGGSGLIKGDSGNVLGSSDLGSGIGSGIGSGRGSDIRLAATDDDDDDLVLDDGDDDLVLGSGGSDISVAGDSGINLMSPSDSGLSLESEPLDLAGSSISGLDLGAEIGSDIGSGSGVSGSGRRGGSSGGAEKFELSPSGIGLDVDSDSSSQVIEVEEGGFADADAFGEAAFGEPIEGDEGFGADGGLEAEPIDDEDAFGVVPGSGTARSAYTTGGYEVPFSIFQVASLVMVLVVMSLGGMLMTDLVRNMWAYSESSAPVSSLTDALISLVNLGG